MNNCTTRTSPVDTQSGRYAFNELKNLPSFKNWRELQSHLEAWSLRLTRNVEEVKAPKKVEMLETLQLSRAHFLQLVKQFVIDTGKVDVVGLTMHLYPDLQRSGVKATPQYKLVTRSLQILRTAGDFGDVKRKDYLPSVEGMAHVSLVHSFLNGKLRHYWTRVMPYEDAFDIGRRAIDKTFPKFNPAVAKYSNLLFVTLERDLRREATRRRKCIDISTLTGNNASRVEPVLPSEPLSSIMDEVIKIARRRNVTGRELLLWSLLKVQRHSVSSLAAYFKVRPQAIDYYVAPLQQTIKRELSKLF